MAGAARSPHPCSERAGGQLKRVEAARSPHPNSARAGGQQRRVAGAAGSSPLAALFGASRWTAEAGGGSSWEQSVHRAPSSTRAGGRLRKVPGATGRNRGQPGARSRGEPAGVKGSCAHRICSFNFFGLDAFSVEVWKFSCRGPPGVGSSQALPGAAGGGSSREQLPAPLVRPGRWTAEAGGGSSQQPEAAVPA